MQVRKLTHKKNVHGLTLMELLVTFAVVAILVSMSMPTMRSMLAQWARDKATRTLVNHLQLARSTAIKTSKRVVMCNSVDGIECAPSKNFDWSVGWIIFQDDNANNVFDTGEIIVANEGGKAGISSISSSNKIRQFVFLPTGLMAAGMSSLVITPTTGTSIKIIVNRVGRVRLSSAESETP